MTAPCRETTNKKTKANSIAVVFQSNMYDRLIGGTIAALITLFVPGYEYFGAVLQSRQAIATALYRVTAIYRDTA